MWFSFLGHFSRKYKITLFDFPHQGRGKVMHGSNSVSLDEQVGILHQVAKQLRIKRPIVCSASWGGVIALFFALKYPQEAKKLVLASMGYSPARRCVR